MNPLPWALQPKYQHPFVKQMKKNGMLKLLLRNNFGEVFPGHKDNWQFPTNNPDFCRIERYYSLS